MLPIADPLPSEACGRDGGNKGRQARYVLLGLAAGGLALGVAVALIARAVTAERAASQRQEAQRRAAATAVWRGELAYESVPTLTTGMEQPRDIAVDGEGRLVVVGDRLVKIMTVGGEVLRRWATAGAARCVAADAAGRIYVGEDGTIEVFDREGRRLRSWGKAGAGPGEFGLLTDLAVAGEDILVADAGNRRVHLFDGAGQLRRTFGLKDAAAGYSGLILPSPHLSIAADSAGYIYLNNPGRFRVEKFAPDGRLVGFWGTGGTKVQEFCGCCNPVNLQVTAEGRVITAEKGLPRVKVYDGSGRLLALMGRGILAEKCDDIDLAVDAQGRIYALDAVRRVIHVFAPKKPGPPAN